MVKREKWEENIINSRRKIAKSLGVDEERIGMNINKLMGNPKMIKDSLLLNNSIKEFVNTIKDIEPKQVFIPTAIWTILSSFFNKEEIIKILEDLKKHVEEGEDILDKPNYKP